MLAVVMTATIAAMLAPVFGAPLFVMLTPGIPLGIAGVIASVRLLRRGGASRHWPSARCQILSSVVERRMTLRGEAQSDNFYWAPLIKYEFIVAGRRCDGVESGNGISWSIEKNLADRFAAQFPAVKDATVYYNPTDPADSCLIRGQTRGAFIGLVISLILTVNFSGAVFVMWKMRI